MGTTFIGIGPNHGNTCCSCCHPPAQGDQPVSDNIDSCYCNCCACVPTGPLCFEMVACSIAGGGLDTSTPCMCSGFSFTMDKGTEMCYYHSSGSANPGGGQCTVCPAEYTTQPTGGYIEAWGFSGTVCSDCTTSQPPMSGTDCGGMCITASLCCCKTGIQVTGALDYEHPCPVQAPAQCASVGHGMATGAGDFPCYSHCFWFEIEPYNCYTIGTASEPNSPCSICSTYTGEGELPQETVGTLSTNNCAELVSGQCMGSTGEKFMLLVEGEFLINCDCQTGVVVDPMLTPPIQPVAMKWSGLITEC